jgi:hypothetical protein
VATSAVTGRGIEGRIVNAGGNITIGANTSWVGASFDNAGTITFPVAAVLSVPAGTGATFSEDDGGGIDNLDPGGHLFVDSSNTVRIAAQTGPFFPATRPGSGPAVVIHSAALVYTGTAPSDIEVEGQSTMVGDVPRFSLLAIECSGSEPAVLHTSSFTNFGFIGLYGPYPETCNAGRTLSVDSSDGPGSGMLTNTGYLEGYGTIAGNVTNASGTITPGDTYTPCPPCVYTPGQITLTHDYEQDPDGTLSIITNGHGVPGAQPSSELSVGGTAALNGTLSINAASFGRAAPGEIYQALEAARVVGRFGELQGQPSTGRDARYVPRYDPGSVTLEVMNVPTLTVKIAGRGWGEVDSDPDGITCAEGTCTSTFSPTQVVTLTAIPGQSGPFEPVATFAGWSGACHGTGKCKLTMVGDKSVTATFVPPQPPRCTLRLKRRTANPKLTAIAVCNKAARLKLSGTVTEWLGSGRTRRTSHFQLRPVTRKAARGAKTILVIRLPRAVLTALKQRRREAIRLTLQATGPGGTSRVLTGRLPLRP